MASPSGEPKPSASAPSDVPVLALLDYLADLHATKNPPVHRLADEGLFALEAKDLLAVPGVLLAPSEEVWLRVEYVNLPTAPQVPERLVDLLGSEVSPLAEPVRPGVDELLAARLRDDADEQQRERLLEELRGQLAQADQWVGQVWEPWSQRHAEARAAKGLYRDLFAQQSRLAVDRDSVEFLWGFGRLRWRAQAATVDYPLLAASVEIEVDAVTQALTVRTAGGVAVQDGCLAGLDLHDRAGLMADREALAAEPVDPWSPELDGVLRRLVRHLHDHGVVEGDGAPSAGAPLLSPGWTLFLRRRRPDYVGFLDRLRELYRGGAQVPAPLAVLVDDAPSACDAEPRAMPPRSVQRDQLLLPLPANEEQMRILELAQTRPGVVVQGPPGTGKTHTIANLISHYVAHGQRVLVLAEKERALREVTGKVPDGVRALTVSVLGADEESRQQLGASITAIQARVTGIDRDAADREILRLTGALDAVDKRIAETTDLMLRARENEAQQLPGSWPCGEDVSPQTAAAWVRDNVHLQLIRDPLDPSVSCPLTPAELVELTRLVRDLAGDSEQALAFLPDPRQLPTPSDLAAAHQQLAEAQAALQSGARRVRTWERFDASDPRTLAALVQQVHACAGMWRATSSGGWLAGVAKQMADPLLLPEWQAAAEELARQRARIISMRGPLAAHEIELPKPLPADLPVQLASAQEQLAARGRLGVFARAERAAVASVSVDGRVPATVEQVALVRAALDVEDARRVLRTRWHKQTQPVGGPELVGSAPEVEVWEPLQALQAQLALPSEWARIASALRALDVACDARPSDSELAEVAAVCDLLPVRVQEQAAARLIDTAVALLEEGAEQPGASPLWQQLCDAADEGDEARYAAVLLETQRLRALAALARRLRNLHEALSGAAPLWAQQVLADPGCAGDPAELPQRWAWRQLETWVQQVQRGETADVLQRRSEELGTQRADTVTALVTERAWRRLADNLGDVERRGLNEYLKAVSKYGKTGGTYKARRAAEIRRAMDRCKNAVPVWVMTSSRALTSFAPEAEAPFDVLILDEASQAGIEDLPLLSLARQTIVVGDDKQTSPENVGLNRARVFELLDDHLAGLTGYRTLFDPDNSLYDLAQLRFSDLVMLVEHFRCLPDIIAFSNDQFYDGQIQPLRDRPPHPGWQPLGAIKVIDGYRSGDVNQPEAEAVVELLARLHTDPQYEGMTFGVVTLLAGGQAKLIDDLLVERLTPEGHRARQVQVGEPATFQGAERDVIVISTVVATDPANPSGRIGAMNDAKAARRINVAASRAQQQMWVVHSLEPDRFHPDDRRGALIRHCRDPRSNEALSEVNLARCDSEFERLVLGRILARGYRRVRAQYEVGSASRNYRIDIVVEGRSRRLAVECDGERWHGPERWHADRVRQQVLERAGWTFERIRGSAFFRDPTRALEPLWRRLDELGIEPGDDADIPRQPQVYDVNSVDWASRTATDTKAAVSGEEFDSADDLGQREQTGQLPVDQAAGAMAQHEAQPEAVALAQPHTVSDGQASPARLAASPVLSDLRNQPGRGLIPGGHSAAPSADPAGAAVGQPASLAQLDVQHVATELTQAVARVLRSGAGDVQAEQAYQQWWDAHRVSGTMPRDTRRVLNRALSLALRTGTLVRTDGEADCPMSEYFLALPLPAAAPALSRPAARSSAVPAPPGRAPRDATPAQVRAWARASGMRVGERGHLPEAVWWAYHRAHNPSG